MDGFEGATLQDVSTLPLVVDLDDTLLATDTLYESLASGLFRRPAGVLAAMSKLSGGRAAMKRAIALEAELDCDVLPENEALVAYLREQAARGRELYLVSAADQDIVDRVAIRFDFFKSAMGSDGSRNLKGPNKAAYLAETFPEGFVYAGDSSADLAVWERASGAILVGTSAEVTRKARSMTTIEAEFHEPRGRLKDWRKCFRIHQWAKNALLFVALFLGHAYGEPAAWARVIAGFFLFSIAASGTYVINDLVDLGSDRRHATKKTRPLAAGRVPIRLALPLALGAVAIGLFGMLLLGIASFLMLLGYLVLTLAYSFRLKRVPMLDVTTLGALFTIRIAIGAALAQVVLSEWLLVFSMFFFLSLSMAKRYVEVAKKAETEDGMVRGRGYHTGDTILLLNFGISAAACAIFTVCIYLLEAAFPSGAYAQPQFLWIAALSIALWTMRIWLLAYRTELDDDPVAFAVKDKTSVALGGFAAVGVLLAIVV